MGIGFVLAASVIVFGGLAAFAAGGIWVWVRSGQSDSRPASDAVSAFKAALMPVVILAWGGAAFVVYCLWCLHVRHVDIGVGDLANVPIANGYSLCLSDLPGGASIAADGCSGRDLVAGISALAVIGDSVVGRVGSGAGFVFDTRAGAVRHFAKADDAVASFPERPILKSADRYYAARRWDWSDAAFMAIVAFVAAGIFLVWGRRYLWRSPAQS